MIEIRLVESGKLLCLEERGGRAEIERAFDKIADFVKEKKVSVKGDRMVLYYDDIENIDFDQAHFSAAKELSGEVFGDGEVTVVIQPVMKVACLLHQGKMDSLSESLNQLKTWISEHAYRVKGPLREYCVRSGGDQHGNEAITELQIPVEKIR